MTAKAAPVIAPDAVPSQSSAVPVAMGSLAPARRQKSVARPAGARVRAPVVVSVAVVPAMVILVLPYTEHSPVEKEVAELVVVHAAAQTSVERPKNPDERFDRVVGVGDRARANVRIVFLFSTLLTTVCI